MTLQDRFKKLRETAYGLIEAQVDAHDPIFCGWKDEVFRLIANHYGEDSLELRQFWDIRFRPGDAFSSEEECRDSCASGLQQAKCFLDGLIADFDLDGENNQGLKYEYDVFISHAAANKAEFVEGLKQGLKSLGVKAWYDSDEIEWGDSWKKRIYDGLEKCRFGIIVLSPEFIGREWTEKELNELLSRQNAQNEKVILPLLYNLSVDEMKAKFPNLEEIQAKTVASSTDVPAVVVNFARVLIKSLKVDRLIAREEDR